jgi:hypothetical protein
MKKKIGIIFYLLICSTIVGAAIYAGEKYHSNCCECKLAIGKHCNESDKFAGAWK